MHIFFLALVTCTYFNIAKDTINHNMKDDVQVSAASVASPSGPPGELFRRRKKICQKESSFQLNEVDRLKEEIDGPRDFQKKKKMVYMQNVQDTYYNEAWK